MTPAALVVALLAFATFHSTTTLDVKRKAEVQSQKRLRPTPKQDCSAASFEPWFKLLANLAPHAPGSNVTRAYEPRGNDTLLVESDISAWNNIRMSWETAVCLAYKTRRWYRVPHIPTDDYADVRLKFRRRDGEVRKLSMFDYFDEASFRRVVPAMLDSEPLPPGKVTFATISPFEEGVSRLDDPSRPHLVYQGGPEHMQTRVFAQYADVPEFVPRPGYVHLVESAFRLRRDLICRAVRRLVEYGLEPLSYVALHRRRGDTIGLDGYEVASRRAVEYVAPLVRNRTVLVLTDTHEPSFNRRLTEVAGAKRVVTWANIEWKGDDQVYAPQIDMLAAVPAAEFIGTPLSTFSTGIIRWRTQAGMHLVGDPVHFTGPYKPGYEGWNSPGGVGTYLVEMAAKQVRRHQSRAK